MPTPMMQMATGVFLLNYNLHTDDDWKGNSGNGNGNNKGNSGNGNGNNKDNSGSGNNGKEKNYELIEYLNDVNREHAEVLVEQNINGRTDTSYIYGAEINGGFDRISLDRFDGSTGYYLYDARGSVSGITNEEGQVYQSYRYSVTGEIAFGAPQYENEYAYNGESYNPNIESQYLRARYYCVVTATFLTEDSYLGNQTEPLTLNRYNYCVSSYLNYTDPSGNEVEVLESLKGWIIDPNTQAQKTIENYENQRLSIEDAIESGLLNNRAGQIFLDYGDIVMEPAVKTPADIIVIRETVKGNSDSKEMQRTATAGFYAGFVGQGIEYTQIISNADYQLSMIITSAKGVNSINNPLSYLLFIKDFSLTQTIDAAKAGLQDAWNGTYDSAIGRKIGAGTFNYLLMTIGGALLKGKGTACEAVESGSSSRYDRTGYQSKGRSNNLFGRDRSTRRTTNLTEWRRSISQQDIHNEMRLFLGDDYVKIDSGKWRSLDGTRQFRVKPDDYLGNHGIGQPTVPNTPHVHFEFLTPKSNGNGFDVIKNIHVPIK